LVVTSFFHPVWRKRNRNYKVEIPTLFFYCSDKKGSKKSPECHILSVFERVNRFSQLTSIHCPGSGSIKRYTVSVTFRAYGRTASGFIPTKGAADISNQVYLSEATGTEPFSVAAATGAMRRVEPVRCSPEKAVQVEQNIHMFILQKNRSAAKYA